MEVINTSTFSGMGAAAGVALAPPAYERKYKLAHQAVDVVKLDGSSGPINLKMELDSAIAYPEL